MATKRRRRTAPKYLLSIAAFCTKVLEDTAGLLSGIRFLEYITIPVPADRDPEKREHISIWAIIAFKSIATFKGDHVLRLVLRTPTGKKISVKEMPMKFESHVTGFNNRIKVDLKIKTEGLYRMDVILDGKRYTSMTLRVSFHIIAPPPQEDKSGLLNA